MLGTTGGCRRCSSSRSDSCESMGKSLKRHEGGAREQRRREEKRKSLRRILSSRTRWVIILLVHVFLDWQAVKAE